MLCCVGQPKRLHRLATSSTSYFCTGTIFLQGFCYFFEVKASSQLQGGGSVMTEPVDIVASLSLAVVSRQHPVDSIDSIGILLPSCKDSIFL
jgi:hypothetical protein